MKNKGEELKQKRDRYEMHKYWGKKPSGDLSDLISKYSNPGDTLLDPFAGYGVFCCEAYIMKRNVILNDLNPVANFINNQLLEKDINIDKVRLQWEIIKKEFTPYVKKWYQLNLNHQIVELVTILRNNDNTPVKAKYKLIGSKSLHEHVFSKEEVKKYLKFEESEKIIKWYPKVKLIKNSRISAKDEMSVHDLFTKRTLACHAMLYSLIEKHSSGAELNLFKVAFTANLANCSKLVPPINSRSDISQGAWMTGFYIGPTYIENNVLHYFENRLAKAIKGKEDYLKQFQNQTNALNELKSVDNQSMFSKKTFGYLTLMNDAKKLQIKDNSIDYIFTDPPYGEAVPYFEQSIIWNSWLAFVPDYDNEIVISDSKERDKKHSNFESEIQVAFSEIARVLKPNKYFSLTFHSLSGIEWKAITNACINNGFELHDFQWLVQKSFTPRQINKAKSIKGDVLITLVKSDKPVVPKTASNEKFNKSILDLISKNIKKAPLDTNEIFLIVMKMLFSSHTLVGDFDILKILMSNFKLIGEKWHLNDKL
jgi:DNA modification methylase